ncbi:hypothetical protein AVEN_40191-1 [Araneus ventricosus]|uniref:THAP-type domain-containing protein n=1 Tax=Araneus ventricosus TaxID=182803 RepID=A0A4Y2ULN1_ARAVE|nr:hypothetical protein AVEN_40191-1 [Araneus ventricosus]
MPSVCCVPGCKSNYPPTTENVRVFKFPNEADLKDQWLRKIPRKDFTPTARSVVCVKHFKNDDVIKEDIITLPDGCEEVRARKRFKLKPKAIPSIFPNLPSYLSDINTNSLPSRKDPEMRRESELQRSNKKIAEFLNADVIPCFDELIKRKDVIKKFWNAYIEDSRITYYILKPNSLPLEIKASFTINSKMMINIFFNGKELDNESMVWLIPMNEDKQLKVIRYSQIENLFAYLENKENISEEVSLVNILNDLKLFLTEKNEGEDQLNFAVKFYYEQLKLLILSRPLRYSPFMLSWAFSIFTKSSSVYNELRSSGIFILPSERYLRKISSTMSLTSSKDGMEYRKYLTEKCLKLCVAERTVNLLLDEIIIRPHISYHSNSLTGLSINKSLEKATSVQTFMISSVYSKNKDVAALFPVKNLNSDELLDMTKKVISLIHGSGYKIRSIISDNNRINRNMFTSLCGGELKSWILNSHIENEKIFILFDSVHIIKCIRNNWLNQQTANNTFQFPSFEDYKKIMHASLGHLRDIYRQESKSIIKYAPKLTFISLYPSNIERQNVGLCLKMFDATNANALKRLNDSAYDGTIEFIQIINKWWSIMNVKSPRKGYEQLEENSKPFEKLSDDRLLFLEKCIEWKKEWKKVSISGQKKKLGKLTSETLCSFEHTTNTIKDIIIHQLQSSTNSYVLTGKYQTDPLEGRFGQYRQLCGGNYSISVEQILQAEKKLRITSLLKLHSKKYGSFHLKEFLCDFSEKEASVHTSEFDIKGVDFYNFTEEEEDLIPLYVYLSGYAVYKLKPYLQCNDCIKLLSVEKELIFELTSSAAKEYLLDVDKGKLTYPDEDIVKIFVASYKIFKFILTENEGLLHLENIRTALKKVILEKIHDLNITGTCDTCQRTKEDHSQKFVSVFINIFLNNYSKLKNSSAKISKGKKRKLDIISSS